MTKKKNNTNLSKFTGNKGCLKAKKQNNHMKVKKLYLLYVLH